MINSLGRAQTQLVILSPSRSVMPRLFRNVQVSEGRYDALLAEVQRLRGHAYLDDGAILPNELTADGRFALRVDARSWHVLALSKDGNVCGGLRYLEENDAANFEDLWIRHAALSHSPAWSERFRLAVGREMALARSKRLSFGEVGGWAVAPDRRGTTDALRIILATCGLFQLLGGCAGLATATLRHGSAAILRKAGLRPLVHGGEQLPSYYDPHYRCEMEVLRFDSRFPNPKYADWIGGYSLYLRAVPVICRQKSEAACLDSSYEAQLPLIRPAHSIVPVAV